MRFAGLLLLLAMPVSSHDLLMYVNGAQVSKYSITYKKNCEMLIDTTKADFDCIDYGGSVWGLGENLVGHRFHTGVIPFTATGSGRFVVNAPQIVHAGISQCPAGFWLNQRGCSFAKNSGTIRWRAGQGTGCNLQAGKTYYLNVRLPKCNNQTSGCKVKIAK